MKKGIHPTYHDDVTVTCACGNTFTTGSTKNAIKVEICGACHPFFTGEMKYVDTAGRVDKFKAKVQESTKFDHMKKKAKKMAKKKAQRDAMLAAPQTMKEMIAQIKANKAVQKTTPKSTHSSTNASNTSKGDADNSQKNDK